jgi:hypothetical protein
VAYSALLDANVLHPIVLCDLLLRLAEKGLFRPLWSDEILDECSRSVVRARPDIDLSRLRSRLESMNEAFPDARVVGWQGLVPTLDAEFGSDAHVVAAAIAGRADVIVTENIRDFPRDPTLGLNHILVQDVDEFLIHQWWLSPNTVKLVIAEQAAARKRPARTPGQILEAIRQTAPEFVEVVTGSR